ncbi:hypothetical protein SDC9_162070 [bioreactor metagenome]|uniref:Uncharacterized protein n=1 Tax=bioreactor metagenome TaxID=1076179 RepID=A0A645FK37_9ZZZZ
MAAFHLFVNEGDQFVQPVAAQAKQFLLPLQRLHFVVVRAVENLLHLFQRHLQFFKKQNLLQGFQCRVIIQPVARRRGLGRAQQPNLVIIMQHPHTDTRQV